MQSLRAAALLVGFTAAAYAQARRIEACEIFPPDNVWNNPADALPLDPRSADYLAAIGAGAPLAANFGSGRVNGVPVGVPFTVVPRDAPKLPVQFESLEADPGGYAIPLNAPIEGGAAGTGRRLVLALENENCLLYELRGASTGPGGWRAASGAIFDLKQNSLRARGRPSADPAGLPVLPGLVRYDEVAAGAIRHPLRFSAPASRDAYVWPARSAPPSSSAANLPPMGQRFRLRPDFDLSGFPPQAQVILRALKRYGMILADQGPAWQLDGVPDDRWDNQALAALSRVRGSDFQAVDVASLIRDPEASYVRPETRVANVTNAASYRPGYLSPGMIGSIFGAQLANEPTETRVLFNNETVRAVVLAARPDQINFIVPYAMAGEASAQLEVRYQNRRTFLGLVNIAPAAPGIFTLDVSGAGQGAILNQDFTVNGAQNPAARGSIVQIFATGEGQTDPPGRDGITLTAPAPAPRLPVRVVIGGIEATVEYAGGAPGLVAGAFQVTARVPAALSPGVHPVVLYVGGWPSQEGVTLTVR